MLDSMVLEQLGAGFFASVFTAGALGLLRVPGQVRRHDDEQDEAQEDLRRWLRDRDRVLSGRLEQIKSQMSSEGQLYSGAHLNAQCNAKFEALHEYRDAMSAKLRDERSRQRAEGCAHAALRNLSRPRRTFQELQLDEERRGILARWRAPAEIPGTTDTSDCGDPTAPILEPDIAAFEQRRA